jgi:hypothetical protein
MQTPFSIPFWLRPCRSGKTLWIALAVGDYSDERWFAIEPDDVVPYFKTKAELPPFLRPQAKPQPVIGWLWVDWLPDRLSVMAKGALRGACLAARLHKPIKPPRKHGPPGG